MNSSLTHHSSLPWTESLPSFANLTPVCFTLLCDYLSLQDLISAAQVNQHWRTQIFSYTYVRMHTLEILDSTTFKHYSPSSAVYSHLLTNDDGSRMFPDVPPERFSLKCAETGGVQFSSSLVRSLESLLGTNARLHKLIFEQNILTDEKLAALLHLLNLPQCSHLTTLKLTISHLQLELLTKTDRLNDLFSCINNLPYLERLILKFGSPLDMEPDLQAIDWLREFEFYCVDEQNILDRTVNCYRETIEKDPTKKILLCSFIYSSSMPLTPFIGTLLNFKKDSRSPISQHLKTLHITEFLPVFDGFTRFLVQHYPALTYLKLRIYSNWHHQLSTLAGGLAELLDLEFYIQRRMLQELDRRFEPDQLPRFKSVQTLIFTSPIQDHTQLALLDFSHFFPRLQVFQIKYRHSILFPQVKPTCFRCCPLRQVKDWNDAAPECVAAFRKCSTETFRPWKLADGSGKSTLKYASINDLPVTEL